MSRLSYCLFAVCHLVVTLARTGFAESPLATHRASLARRGTRVDRSAEGDVPKLIITRVESDNANRGVVILPGGGYHGHAMDHEGYQFAEWFRFAWRDFRDLHLSTSRRRECMERAMAIRCRCSTLSVPFRLCELERKN